MSDGPYDVLARDWDKLNKAYDKLEGQYLRLRKAAMGLRKWALRANVENTMEYDMRGLAIREADAALAEDQTHRGGVQ